MDAGVFEFRDQKLERSAGLTAADRKWMDTIVTDVNESWDQKVSTRPTGMHQCVVSPRRFCCKNNMKLLVLDSKEATIISEQKYLSNLFPTRTLNLMFIYF
jgi:hypothetical protein